MILRRPKQNMVRGEGKILRSTRNGHVDRIERCPVLGVERKRLLAAGISGFDPTRTLHAFIQVVRRRTMASTSRRHMSIFAKKYPALDSAEFALLGASEHPQISPS